MTPIEVWGIAAMAKTQNTAFNAHCMGDCGKISMAGAIDDEKTGGLFVCCESMCPYEETVIKNYGHTNSFGQPHTVHLRILKGARQAKLSEARMAEEKSSLGDKK